MHKLIAAALLGSTTLLPALPAQAQQWPTKPITLVAPFPAGGGTDAFARPLAVQLGKQLGRSIVIDNRGGAGGTVGASFAAHAAPDGYTFLIGALHHAIAPSFYNKLDYDVERDLVPLTTIANPPQVVVVNAQKLPARNLQEMITEVRKRPGKFNYGSAGNGTSHHLAGELFKQLSKTYITHIPYRGAGPALQDLIAGQVEIMFDGLGSSAQHIKAGRIRALAVASAKRAPGFPDVPTAAEAGLKGYEVSTWYALFGVKGTPREILERMHAETVKAIATPELREVWTSNGSDSQTMSPDQFAAFLKSEIARWAKVTRESGATLD